MTRSGQREEMHDLDIYLRTWPTNPGYAIDATSTTVNTGAAFVRWYDTTELRASAIPKDAYP
jgi:hypothetical protein